MKKLIALVAFFCVTFSAFSQDIITTRAGEDIDARVIEVGADHVGYRKASNPEGPVFIIPVSDVLMIRYANGEKDIFEHAGVSGRRKAPDGIAPGMKYRDYKDLYVASMYRPEAGDLYSRAWAGIGSFFIPGLGQGIDGEWSRGLSFFGGSLACNLLAFSTAQYESGDGYTRVNFSGISAVAFLASLGINIWSIVDAVRVAKIKNMYLQDLHGRHAAADFKVEPFVACTPAGVSDTQPVAGLSFRLCF